MPALSGILAWASFPTANQGYLAWISLVPLVIFLGRSERPRDAFWGGACAGYLQFFPLLYWMPGVMSRYGGLPAWLAWMLYILAVAVMAVFPATACALTHYCRSRDARFLLLFGPAWVAIEYARSFVPFGGFPWLLSGYSQTDCLWLLQIADIAGVYGVSFLIAWVNAALAWIWLNRQRGWGRYGPALVGAMLVAASLVYGHAALTRWDQQRPQYLAAMLQANLSVDAPEAELRSRYQHGYVDMAAPLSGRNVDLLILPESPTPLFYQYDRGFRETLQGLARCFPLGMVFNNIYFGEVDGEPRYFNSAFFLDRDGKETGRYDKIHLVPFGEYVPLQRLLFFSRTISKDVGNFHPGESVVAVDAGGNRMSALICFEAVFPELSRSFLRAGSQLIINLTNDGWYGDTSAPHQHLAMARWRAVEGRRYLLRAANSGVSAIVAPSGRIQTRTGLFREETAVGGFSFLTQQTFYMRHGKSLPVLCVIILLFAVLWRMARGSMRLD